METEVIVRNKRRFKRALRIRKHLKGTAVKPRMTVFKSNKHLSVQIINDDEGKTLASASTLSKTKNKLVRSKEGAREIGKHIASLVMKQDIQHVVFDRGHNKFHGLIAEVAAGAREAGLQF